MGFFRHIVVLCPTLKWNTTYKSRPWILSDPEVYLVNPGERLHDWLEVFFRQFAGEPTLFIIDDCSAKAAMTQKKHMLSELAFSGRHADCSVWVLTQKYNSVLKDFREQLKWVCLFYCKDRDSFEECLRENDVIQSKEERAEVRKKVNKIPHSKLLLKTDQPAAYRFIP